MPAWMSNVADVIGILGGVFALFAWLQSRRVSKEIKVERPRQDKKIRVILSYGADKLELPVEMRRGGFTRAEVLGRLGMIPTHDGKCFSLSFLNTSEFLDRLNKISTGDGNDTLIIPCTQQEFEQFKV